MSDTIMRKSEIVGLTIILLSFALGIYLYPQLPDLVPSHWNASGEVDAYMPKFYGVFLLPFVSVAVFLLYLAIPKIDPLKHNIAKFRKHFDIFVILIMSFFFYLYLLSILWSFGLMFNMIQAMVPAFGVLFYYCGILTENTKRNWFIGFKTPWTLNSDKVWEKTNKLGGKLFKITGIISLLGTVIQDYAIFFVIIPAVLTVIFTFVYSYFEYQKKR